MTKIIDARLSIAIGLTMFAAGSWMLCYLNADAGIGDIFWPRVLQGFALGFLFVPMTTATLADVSREKMANATGIYTLVRQLGGGFGIAILQLVQQRSQALHYAILASGVTTENPTLANFLHGAHDVPTRLQHLIGLVSLNAAIMSYNDTFQLCAIVFIVSIPTVFLLSGKTSTTSGDTIIAE
jgi:DHA2 family multidrug resistance protein